MQLTAMLLVFLTLIPIDASHAETRKLKLHFLHTGEKAEITYKKNGRYISSGLKKVNRFLRDWRRNEPTKMDPKLLDLIWEVYKETRSKKYIKVISGYRSPKTNSLLRKRGRGVAKKSQHSLGKALDFFIPGVKLSKLRAIGLRKGLGGVGYYPRSGSPFVHMDTGRVRHWPRMSRKELVRVFPRGKTLHVPTDGKPLPGYNQAKAEYERKKSGKFSVASAEQIRKKPSLLKKLFTRDDEDEGVPTSRSIAKKPVKAPSAPQPVKPQAPAVAAIPAVPTPTLSTGVPVPAAAQPTTNPGVPTPQAPIPGVETPEVAEPTPVIETPEVIIASLTATQLPVPQFSPRVQLAAATPQETPESELAPDAETDVAEETVEENSEIEIATAIPVPTRSPNLLSNSLVAANTQTEPIVEEPKVEEEIVLQPVLQVAALSPSEIEDLRNQVYLDANTVTPAQPNSSDIQLLTALSDNKTDTNNQASASDAINAQLSGIPAQEETTVAISVESFEAIKPEPLQIAAANIPIPARSPINIAKLRTASTAPAKTVSAEVVDDRTINTPSSIEERMIGQWAFATKQSIQKISKIEPIDYSKNLLGKLPSSIESSGFSILNQNRNANSFTGSTN